MGESMNDCAKRETQVGQQLEIQSKIISQLADNFDRLRQGLTDVLRSERCENAREAVEKDPEELVPVASKIRTNSSALLQIDKSIKDVIGLCEV